MEAVGMLRHPNLVAVRAYFQAKQERLVIYDYQPNGSLFNLIHGIGCSLLDHLVASSRGLFWLYSGCLIWAPTELTTDNCNVSYRQPNIVRFSFRLSLTDPYGLIALLPPTTFLFLLRIWANGPWLLAPVFGIYEFKINKGKALHWTPCLKIAEDVAQGLAYIHHASKLTHGNLKSSNVLLGSDFEACLTDYSLIALADISSDDDPDSARYKAPEVRKSARRASPGSDVYAYGILLLELLTGKPPSQHPHLSPPDMPDWVRAMREDDNEEDRWLVMLVDS
ncbi:hypothetical protein HAX54_026734 [Datura stramonium]|uniref:Protein kinase domain-containing protein n=1 Tax=Datura stramonium TaxID=4076 RepID=A0ABS8S846_DATST|nr:hypothetical protein [Datura stramonium]